MKACRQCGLENEEGATFCGNCGEFLAWEQTPGGGQPQTSTAATITDPTSTPVVAGDLLQQALLQQARVAGQPDERKPDAVEKPATITPASRRTVDIGVSASPPEVFV